MALVGSKASMSSSITNWRILKSLVAFGSSSVHPQKQMENFQILVVFLLLCQPSSSARMLRRQPPAPEFLQLLPGDLPSPHQPPPPSPSPVGPPPSQTSYLYYSPPPPITSPPPAPKFSSHALSPFIVRTLSAVAGSVLSALLVAGIVGCIKILTRRWAAWAAPNQGVHVEMQEVPVEMGMQDEMEEVPAEMQEVPVERAMEEEDLPL